jgi:hypothetical protein
MKQSGLGDLNITKQNKLPCLIGRLVELTIDSTILSHYEVLKVTITKVGCNLLA